jgi:hypothetical protein
LATCNLLFDPAGKPKYLETLTSHLDLLQPFEIPQNRQHILWKSLEKTTIDLEILAKSLEAEAAAASVARTVA